MFVYIRWYICAYLAQLADRTTLNRVVVGSIPTWMSFSPPFDMFSCIHPYSPCKSDNKISVVKNESSTIGITILMRVEVNVTYTLAWKSRSNMFTTVRHYSVLGLYHPPLVDPPHEYIICTVGAMYNNVTAIISQTYMLTPQL